MEDRINVLKDILVKKGGNWKDFITPIHKKVLPVIIPALAMGFVFYNIIILFMGQGFTGSLKGKFFLTAVIFLYLWLVILLFVLSSLVFTVINVYQRSPPVMERLNIKEKIK